jgi:hypothetical protein
MMRKLSAYTFVILAFLISFVGCTTDQDNANTTATSTVTPPPTQRLQLTPEPPRITELRKTRGEQDQAKPVVKIVSPADGSTVDGSTVQVRLTLSGDLKGYQPHKDPATGTGNHIHVILDDNPYEAYYDLNVPFELKNVTPGKHLLRVFPSRPWHESYKNDEAFQLTMFTVNGGGDASKPTTTGTGQTMADNNSNQNATQRSIAVDRTKPLLTYSRPKGEYKGEEADPIMIDFWLSNAKLKGEGGEYRVRYIVDDDEPRFIDKWEPVWLAGWLNGKHTVRLELIGPDGYPFKNGSLNITTREITVVK